MGATKSATRQPLIAATSPAFRAARPEPPGAPASRITTAPSRPRRRTRRALFSVPAHTSAAAVPGSLASSTSRPRHGAPSPERLPATGVNATLTSTSASRVAEHRTASRRRRPARRNRTLEGPRL